MNLSKIVPTVPEVAREGLIVLGGILIAAYVLSRFPKIRDWVAAQSITVKDSSGRTLY
ncbi:hypothetical protein CLU90_1003 [Janthinobacterium sp. 67]|uniref:hypothetical protein n=1 Tax=Janthinobacterium sp. 67 TaxID=2035207 RepID=UPI000CC0ADC0|nr:hypothetical protein [Janthinobacterium sp. 67]PJJ17823.1 hypothetical protein CLU90_1003 [Janthinobacterium sp. 67]